MRRPHALPILLVLAIVVLLLGATSASAATLIVTSQDDADDGTCDVAPGHCSLREAIHAANATDAADRIIFKDDEPITPATELPAITRMTHMTAFDTGRCDADSAPLRLSGRGADFSGLVFAPGSDGSNICLVNVGASTRGSSCTAI
jgi:CSLREA domain-containing protein